MAIVNVTITTKKQLVPSAGFSLSASVRHTLQQDGVVKFTTTAPVGGTATFSVVPDGTYTAHATRINLQNAPIGDEAVSQPFTVVNTTEIDVPDVVTVAI